MKRFIFITANFIAGISIAGALASCAGKTEEPMRRSVITTAPSPREGVSKGEYSGRVKENDEVSLGFKTAGQLQHVYVKEGDLVKKGQLLATLDAADYQLAVNAVQAQYDQVKDEVERVAKLYQKNGVSANEYEKAAAGLRQLEVQLQANKNKVAYTKLYSPITGHVKSVNFSAAEMVDAGTAVFSLLDDSGLKVEFDAPVALSPVLKSGVSFFAKSSDGTSLIPLNLISVSPKADGNQLQTVTLAFATRPDYIVSAGMNTTVVMESASSDGETGGFNVPLRAVFDKDGVPNVWILTQDTTVVSRPVAFEGMDQNGMAAIISGLEGNEKIVIAGVNSLTEGEKVTEKKDDSKTNVGGLM